MAKKNNFELLTFLSGLTFFCASLEILIPKPIPFLRFGFANGVIMLSATILDFKSFFTLLLLKVLGQGIISGTLFSYVLIYSVVGTFSSGLVSFCLIKTLKKKLSFIGISCAGAFVSNASQLLLAYFFVFGKGTATFVPAVLTFGLISSLGLGLFVENFTKKSFWYKSFFSQELKETIKIESTDFEKTEFAKIEHEKLECEKNEIRKTKFTNENKFFAKIIFTALLVIIGLFIKNFWYKAFVFGLSVLVCAFSKVKLNLKVFFIFCFSIMLVNIFQISGEVIFEIFNFKITKGAIFFTLEKIFNFQSILFFSKWIFFTKINFKGNLGRLLSKSFENFNLLVSSEHLLDKKNLIKSLDNILFQFDF